MMMSLCEFCSSLPFGNFHLDISAGCCGVHSSHYPINMLPQHRPLRIAEHDECDCTNRQILLVTHIFVGSEEYFKSSLFSRLQQFSVLEFLPPPLGGCLDHMSFEEFADGDRSPLVKEDQHQRVSVEE